MGNGDVTMRKEPPRRDSIVDIYFRVCELHELATQPRSMDLDRINSETTVSAT